MLFIWKWFLLIDWMIFYMWGIFRYNFCCAVWIVFEWLELIIFMVVYLMWTWNLFIGWWLGLCEIMFLVFYCDVIYFFLRIVGLICKWYFCFVFLKEWVFYVYCWMWSLTNGKTCCCYMDFLFVCSRIGCILEIIVCVIM